MKIAYISGPYRAKTFIGKVLNILRARRVATRLWRQGYAVICPHMNTALFGHQATVAYVAGDLAIISRLWSNTDLLVMLPGWMNSAGARVEYATAVGLGLKILHSADYSSLSR